MILPTCPPKLRSRAASFRLFALWLSTCQELGNLDHLSKLIWAKVVQSSSLETAIRLCIFFIVWVVAESFRECRANRMGSWNPGCLSRIQHGFWCCETLLFWTIDIKWHPMDLEGLFLLILDFSEDLSKLHYTHLPSKRAGTRGWARLRELDLIALNSRKAA